MQINSAPFSTLNISRPTELQDKARAPVTIDATSFAVENDTAQERPVTSSIGQQGIAFNDAQQARFIRSFSITEEPSANNQDRNPPSLPQGVQQYIQTASISNEPAQSLLDETV